MARSFRQEGFFCNPEAQRGIYIAAMIVGLGRYRTWRCWVFMGLASFGSAASRLHHRLPLVAPTALEATRCRLPSSDPGYSPGIPCRNMDPSLRFGICAFLPDRSGLLLAGKVSALGANLKVFVA